MYIAYRANNKQIYTKKVKKTLTMILCLCCAVATQAQPVEIQMEDGLPLVITPLTDNSVRVRRGPASTLPELTYVPQTGKIKRKVVDKNGVVGIVMDGMAVEVEKSTGMIIFYDGRQRPILTEEAYSLTPGKVHDEDTHVASVQFDSPSS